jgi:molecular chaperone GrpE (heat shock protein)
MKIIKNLTIGLIIGLSNISYAGLFSNTLDDKELKIIHLCENTKTGVARYSHNLLFTANILRKSGVKFEASTSGDDMTIEIGGMEKIEMSLIKIDVGDLKKYNITCYQAQELEGPKGELSRKDKTLNSTTISALKLFGYLQPTEKDKALAKEKRNKANALDILQKEKNLQEKLAKEQKEKELKQAEAEKLATIKSNEQKILREQKKKARQELNAKRNKYLKMIADFETSSNIHKLKDKKVAITELILTDKVLDDLTLLLDNLEAEIPKESKNRRKELREDIDELYGFFDVNKRIKINEDNLPQYNFYGDNHRGYYKTWSERTKENIKEIQK